MWVQDDQLDIDHHVRHVRLPRPGTQVQLEACVGRLHAELLDRARPLWRLAIIDGLKSGQVAYWPLSIVEHGLALNITVMSYAGAMGFGFTTARCAVPNAGLLCRALQEALDELVLKSKSLRLTR